jgi:hypothetical protein
VRTSSLLSSSSTLVCHHSTGSAAVTAQSVDIATHFRRWPLSLTPPDAQVIPLCKPQRPAYQDPRILRVKQTPSYSQLIRQLAARATFDAKKCPRTLCPQDFSDQQVESICRSRSSARKECQPYAPTLSSYPIRYRARSKTPKTTTAMPNRDFVNPSKLPNLPSRHRPVPPATLLRMMTREGMYKSGTDDDCSPLWG